MSSHEKTRMVIFSPLQHLLQHSLSELTYSNPNLPDVINNAEEAMNWLFGALYPKVMPAVADPASLPLVGNNLKELRFVDDDGDGKTALYQWEQYDGDLAPEWKKIADMDWGMGDVVSSLVDVTQPLFMLKQGSTDYDLDTELPLAGNLAGQHLYGGDTANQHLTLHANNGDAPGLHTGFVQFDDDVRPLDTYDFGTASERWGTGYFGTLVIGTASLTITSDGTGATISDSNTAISFADNNLTTLGNTNASIVTASTSLIIDDGAGSTTVTAGSILSSGNALTFGASALSTTGTIGAGVATFDSDIILSSGSITSVSGAISFGNENLSTSGTLGVGVVNADQINVDDIRLDANSLSITTLATNLNISATGIIDILSSMEALDADFVGSVGIAGDLTVDELSFNGEVITSTGDIRVASDLLSDSDGISNLGAAGARFNSIFLDDSISDGANSITMATLLSLRDVLIDSDNVALPPLGVGETGHSLFWDGAKWVASNPDSEIDHGDLANILGTDHHTQYALLAGRTGAGGQTLNGSDTTAESLSLVSNSVDAEGVVITPTDIRPITADVYDLGASGASFDNLYMVGQAFGLRAQNVADQAAADAAATLAGRLFYNQATGFLNVDQGGVTKKVGHNTYNVEHAVGDLASPIDVSARISDARNAIWQLCSIADNEEVMGVTIQKAAGTVTIVSSVTIPAGNYRLIGIEV